MPPPRKRSEAQLGKSIWQHTSDCISKNNVAGKEASILYLKALLSSFLAFDKTVFLFTIGFITLFDIGLLYFMLHYVKYTNIDWTAYMEQVRIFKNGQLDYYHIRGDTGPLVYPAGHLYIYTFLNYITDDGANIARAQLIFAGLYLVNQGLIYCLFYQSKKIGAAAVILMVVISHRLHSIYVLRLFNDPIAMFFLFLASNLFVKKQFALGCLFYSLGVSVKMNVLLFAPAVFFILLLQNGLIKTVLYLSICAITQVAVGAQFLLAHPLSYLGRAFELGRVFQYRWSVNWQFLPEDLFLATKFHLILLLLHIILLLVFIFGIWYKEKGGVFGLLLNLYKGKTTNLDANDVIFSLFSANLAGIVFARSIHFQFYSWYYHSLFFLAFTSVNFDPVLPGFNSFWKNCYVWIIIAFSLIGVEVVYNVYPPKPCSSLLLFIIHMSLTAWLIAKKRKDSKLRKKSE